MTIRSLDRAFSVFLLRLVRPAFCDPQPGLSGVLSRYGFNRTLVEHPELLFLNNSVGKGTKPVWLLRLALKTVAKSVRNEALHCPKGNAALLALGMEPFFGRYVKNLLEESTVPRIDYNVPETHDKDIRRVVYSVNTGKYDNVRELRFRNPGVEYLMFTNNRNLTSETWKVIFLESELGDVELSRDVKMSPHKYLPKEYGESVYVDANSTIYGDISKLCNFLSEEVSFAVTKHCYANTVLEEIDRCVRIKGIDREKAMAQYERYREWGFEDNLGLAECTILVRRHNDPKLVELMEEWWNEFSNGIRRDQISLLPCVSHQSFKAFRLVDGCVWNNQFCVIGGHVNQ